MATKKPAKKTTKKTVKKAVKAPAKKAVKKTAKKAPVSKLGKLNNALQALTAVDAEFPIQWALVFLAIAENEGAALKDIAEETGISMSVMSRTIGALSNQRRMGKPYGIVIVKMAKDDRRRKELFLSAKGKRLLEKLKNAL